LNYLLGPKVAKYAADNMHHIFEKIMAAASNGGIRKALQDTFLETDKTLVDEGCHSITCGLLY